MGSNDNSLIVVTMRNADCSLWFVPPFLLLDEKDEIDDDDGAHQVHIPAGRPTCQHVEPSA